MYNNILLRTNLNKDTMEHIKYHNDFSERRDYDVYLYSIERKRVKRKYMNYLVAISILLFLFAIFSF